MARTTIQMKTIGCWQPDRNLPRTGDTALVEAMGQLTHPLFAVNVDGQLGFAQDGTGTLGAAQPIENDGYGLLGWAAPLPMESLGDPGFCADLGLRYAYVCGAMANGITSVEMVEAAGKAGMIGFFGAGGLAIGQIEAAIDRLQACLGDRPYGFNLIHSPNDMRLEQQTVELYLAKGVRLISASAYLDLTTPLVQYRVTGIHHNDQGDIVCPNRIIAKVSREEVARKFFSPAPDKHLALLVEKGAISAEQAKLARQVPMAQDLSAEADSGGHTDNRPALCLFPTMVALRDELARQYNYTMPLRVGLGGGIATPASAAAAFAMGAAYILTGSVNQACLEADTSPLVKKMLAEAQQADIIMAPAADMFEMGVKVQVLKRGTMFSMRGARLYEIYRNYDSFEAVPADQRKLVEESFLKCSFEQEWANTKAFFMQRDPDQVQRAERDPKHQMALVFRSYLGRASLWAKTGEKDRAIDYQIWCGPAMGAFNEWVRDSFLQPPENRKTVTIAHNLLYGAAVLLRCNQLKNQGVAIDDRVLRLRPLTDKQLSQHLAP